MPPPLHRIARAVLRYLNKVLGGAGRCRGVCDMEASQVIEAASLLLGHDLWSENIAVKVMPLHHNAECKQVLILFPAAGCLDLVLLNDGAVRVTILDGEITIGLDLGAYTHFLLTQNITTS